MTNGDVMISGVFGTRAGVSAFEYGKFGRADLGRAEHLVVGGRSTVTLDPADLAANTTDMPQPANDLGVLGTTMATTPTGRRMVADLAVGDTVLGDGNRKANITAITQDTTPRAGLKIRAPYFGLDQDLVTGYDQNITIISDVAEYLFGHALVSVPVRAFKDGMRVLHHELRPRDAMYQVQLSNATTLHIGDCLVNAATKFGKQAARKLDMTEARCFAAEHREAFAR